MPSTHIHAGTGAPPSKTRPWLRWYGVVPVDLSYSEMTLYEAVAATARRLPDSVAWDFMDTTATYGQFLRMIDVCANGLAELGIKRADRIVIALPTSPQGVITFYATNKLGAVPAFIHPLSSGPELEHCLDATGAKVVLTLDALYDRVASVRPRVALETVILARIPDYLSHPRMFGFWLTNGRHIEKVPADRRVLWWRTLMTRCSAPAPIAPATTDDPAAILFSAGTTGTPKGIVLSSRNFIAEGMQVAAWGGMDEHDSVLATLPLFHGFGLSVCLNVPFMIGSKVILTPIFSPKIAARLIRRKRPSLLVGVPTFYEALTRNALFGRTDLSSVRGAYSGADALPRPTRERFEQLVVQQGGKVKLREGYGLTETVSAIIAMPLDQYREGSIGVPLPGTLATVCEPGTSEELPACSEGEICISGPAVMIGYLDDPQATGEVLRIHKDGRVWLHTGDLGHMDADGFFYFTDRLKRLIKSSGFNVFPGQVEAELYKHPLVAQVCVVGVPDVSQVERVKAFVVLKDQSRSTPETKAELIAYCRSRLIKWSCPREIEFRSELPMTRLGKVDYRALTRDERAHQYGAVNRVAPHGGDSVAAALQAQKVAVVFTLCGGHISPILTGAKARGIRVVDVRSEATAVFAADAVSRLTGAPGVAAVTAGPGVTNAVTALKNAQLAQSAVVLLAGAAPTLLHGRGALQDIDQRAVVAPHVKLASKIKRARDIGQAIASAFTIAREGVQGPAFVECAADLLYGEATVRAWYLDASGKDHSLADRLQRFYVNRHLAKLFAGTGTAAATPSSPIATPAPRGWSIAAAVECIGRASRPLVVIGSQALAGEDPHRVAAAVMRLGIPTYLSGMARGLLGRDHPLQLRHRRREALREADCVILAGVSCDFRLDYGRQLRSTLIAANRSRKDATLNRRPDIVAIGDAGLFLEQLSDHTSDPTASWQGWLNELRARDEARNAEIARQGVAHGELVNPIALLQAVDKVASDNAIFVADGGDFVATASYIVRPRKPRSWLDPGPFGTLGAGAGFALGAALCSPDSEIWILFGDGACGYSIIEFDTFVRHRIPIIAVIGNDAGWTQIAREQAKWLKDDVGTVLARSSYHDVAAAFGAEGILVKTTAEVPAALERARSVAKAGQPALVNAWLDRSEFREGSISM